MGAGMLVHMDGARIANALARLNAAPAQATWKAGVDVLSFGATKGGALAAEAVLFFDPRGGANMPERRKRAGHLLSKHRFLAAQIEAYLADDCGLGLHATPMPWRIGWQRDLPLRASSRCGRWRRTRCLSRCRARSTNGSGRRARIYYPWTTHSLAGGVALKGDEMLVRLVTSFATNADEVDRLWRRICVLMPCRRPSDAPFRLCLRLGG